MFQLLWANMKMWEEEPEVYPERKNFEREAIDEVLLLNWEEHCVECAVPDCYKSCSLYARRLDGACARFTYGIVPNKKFKGLYDFGADVRFKKWGKIEADLSAALAAPVETENLRKLHSELYASNKSNSEKRYTGKPTFDAFLLECYYPGKESFNLLLEYFVRTESRKTKFREVFVIKPGYNFYKLPWNRFNIEEMDGYIYLYPEISYPEKRIIFTWLDFVKYKHNVKTGNVPPATDQKIKCVAWDLDNTLWNGVLTESAAVDINTDALNLVKQLDYKGILQTIISKNDHDTAWKELSRHNLEQYFLYPAINWGQKSENLIKISKQLNIALNTFAVIDDSAFERAEIKAAIPPVKVYSEKEISCLHSYPEFQVPETEMNQTRRLKYITEVKREKIQSSFSGNYEDFLLSCKMVLTVFIPRSEPEINRCWELIQRTNQLNLSGKRYSIDEFSRLLSCGEVLSLALKAHDRFGDYGTIGFISIDFGNEVPVVNDFVMSCRIAQKRMEHAFFKNFSLLLQSCNIQSLQVRLIVSERNKPLRQVFEEFPFTEVEVSGESMLLNLNITSLPNLRGIVTVEFDKEIAVPVKRIQVPKAIVQ